MKVIKRILSLVFLFIFILIAISTSDSVVFATATEINGYTKKQNEDYQSYKNLYLFAETIGDAKDEIKVYEANIKAMEEANPNKYKSEIAESKSHIKRLNDLLDEMKESDYKTFKKSEKYVNKFHSDGKLAKEVINQLKEIKNYLDLANSITNAALDWAKNGANADHIANSFSLASSVIKLGLTLLNPTAGIIGDAVFSIISNIIKSSDCSESEIKQLQNKIMDRLDDVDFHIDEVQRDISALSKNVNASTKEIISQLSNAIEASFAKQQINDFLSSKNGNFDYSLFKEFLYASPDINSLDYSRNALYYKLLTLEENNAPKEKIKEAYDELYRALDVSESRGEKTPVEKLYEYMLKSDSGIESIQYYYFEFISANNKDEDIVPALEAIEFTLDLYTSAIMADVCIRYCNSYQLQHLEEINGELCYRYGTANDEYITYDDIIGTSKLIDKREVKLEEQILNDITAILNIGNSYSLEVGDNLIFPNNNGNNFGNVQNGDTIYLNNYPSSQIINRFGLEKDLFEYKFYYNGNIISDKGIYTVQLQKGSIFSGEVSYKGIKLYSIDYIVDSNWFISGNGTEKDPYIITTLEQLELINQIDDGYQRYYKLFGDIDIQEEDNFFPIGTKLNPFNGFIDGNGFSIKNLNVNDSTTSGFIRYLGEKGRISNLKFENAKISILSQNKDNLYAGVVAGINYGKIENCIVTNSSYVSIKRENTTPNYILYSYAGGIVGANYGNIINTYVDNLEVKNESKHEYQANSDGKNQHYVYAGGIVGASLYGNVSNAYAGSGLKLTINAESKCSAALSSRHPYVQTYSGGILGYASNTNISCTYSELISENNIANIKVDNSAFIGGASKNNCRILKETYVASYSEEDNDRVKANSRKEAFEDFTLKFADANTITYSFNCEKDEVFFDLYLDQVYEYGENEFKDSNLNILINGEEVDFYIVDVYGFSPYFSSFKEENYERKYLDAHNNVTVVVKLIQQNCIQKVIIPIVTKKVTPVGLEIVKKPNNVDYNVIDKDLNISIEGLITNLIYQDGYINDVTNNIIYDEKLNINSNITEVQKVIINENGIVTSPAKSKVNIKYLTEDLQIFETSFEVNLFCNHYWINEVIQNHCEHLGYTLHKCDICGLQYKDNFSTERLPHEIVIYSANDSQSYIIEGYQGYYDSTCKNQGYSGDLYCVRCQSIIEKGTDIDLKKHVYNNELADRLSHYCIYCSNPENHYFYTKETDTCVNAYCQYCGYEKKYLANSQEKIKELPRIIVSDAYALPQANEVTVYVELHGNVGITSAYFSILYPEVLILKKYSLGNVLNKSDVAEFMQYSDHLNVQLASKDTELSKRGTLLKLVFALPENSSIDDEYRICISGQKLTDENEIMIEFITLDGSILVVDRLPGDVNGDGIVDLLDATLIAKYNVSDDKNGFELEYMNIYKKFDINFGDVSLDGLKDGTDIVKILRYIVGGYNTKIWAKRFKIILEYNNELLENEFIYVEYDNGNGTYGDALPEAILEGYKFEGWYIDRDYKTKVTNDSNIIINPDQIKQTLYAKYTLNTVIFDGNGGSTDSIINELFYTDYNNNQVIEDRYLELGDNGYLKTTETKFLYGGYESKTETVQRNHIFLGWATSKDGKINLDLINYVKLNTNNLIFAIDLKSSGYFGIGNIELYAIWSKEQIEPRSIQNYAYTFVQWKNSSGKTWTNVDNLIVENNDIYTAEWQVKPVDIEFRGNGGSTANGLTSYRQENYYLGYNLIPNNFMKTGYTFLGWSLTDENDSNSTIIKNGEVLPISAYSPNKDIVLYAVWKYSYQIIYNANIPANAIRFNIFQKQFLVQNYNTIESQNLIITDYIYELDQYYNFLEDTYIVPGWNLVGWKDNRGQIYKLSDKFKNLTSCDNPNRSATLYAVWELNPYEVGSNVESGKIVSNSDGSNNFIVYRTLDSTPWSINENVIFDWRCETNCDFNNSNRNIPEGQKNRTGNLDILNSTEKVYFIGKKDQVFNNFGINLCNFTDSAHQLTLNFFNFSFNTNVDTSIVQWRSDGKHSESGPDLHIVFGGVCNFGTNYLGGNIFGNINRPINSLTFEGNGEATIRGGQGHSGINNGDNGQDGGVAIYTNKMVINTDEDAKIKIFGGNGGSGACGRDGDNGANCDKNDGGNGKNGYNGGSGGAGASAISTDIIIFNSHIFLQSGNSGDGGNGGQGGDAGSWYHFVGCGAKPGNGGTGGNGGNAGAIYKPLVYKQCIGLNNCCTEYGVYGKEGFGGQGGKAGNHTGWFKHSCWGASGDNGVNGLKYLSSVSFSNHTYKLFSANFTWAEAKEWAELNGGHLVTITSLEENNIVQSLISDFNLNRVWIGLNDAENEGVWCWVTGENYSYSNWQKSQPDNYNNEDYVEILNNGEWNDITGTYRSNGFVIEFE